MLQRNPFVIPVIVLITLLWTGVSLAAPDCKECVEVSKGKIPTKFLDPSLKELPSGIAIWDVPEAIKALKKKDEKYLWVDTRPGALFKRRTVQGAVNIVCDLKGVPIPDSDISNAMSMDRLFAEMKKVDPDISAVKAIFFCQGPKCHRSYNAALRCIAEYGLSVDQVVWFRGGYPNLEKKVLSDPKLKRRMKKYLSAKASE